MPLLTESAEPMSTPQGDPATVSVGDGVILKALAEWQPESGDGLALQVDDEPSGDFARAPLITINFPTFHDGRGLSLAVLLRTRYDFTGELRAVGDVHQDLLHYMRRCGFDSYELPEQRTQPAADNRQPFAPYSAYYQASAIDPEPAFRRVARGR